MNELIKISQLSNLIKDPELEKLNLTLHTPNIFNILSITKTEIRHSNFLAWLMTPSQSHNLNTIFIKWFLKEVFSSAKVDGLTEFQLDSMNLNNIKVLREWQNIDLLIIHEEFVLVIENKVDSSEHSNQLNKYFQVIDKAYPKLNKIYVFLTIDGINPEDENDSNIYISIDYGKIKSIIEIILSVYQNSLSQRIQYYIEDYLLILNRYIMKENNDSVKIAIDLYKNHKDAIDFIIENIPDKFAKIKAIIEETICENGYILGPCSKYYARFFTKELNDVMPKTGTGWVGKECFLFEITYSEKSLTLKFVISPGNENNRAILSNIIKSIDGSKKDASGKKWLTFYSDLEKVSFNNENDIDVFKDAVNDLLIRNKYRILQAQSGIIENISHFES